MNRYEFVDKLRMSLTGKLTQSAVSENIRYYEDYIDAQIRSGVSEEKVMESLGDPRLIAKSIVEAGKHAENSSEYTRQYDDVEMDSDGNFYSSSYEEAPKKPKRTFRVQLGGWQGELPGWLIAVVTIAVFVLFMVVILSLLSFMAPIILPIMAIMFLIYFIKDMSGR